MLWLYYGCGRSGLDGGYNQSLPSLDQVEYFRQQKRMVQGWDYHAKLNIDCDNRTVSLANVKGEMAKLLAEFTSLGPYNSRTSLHFIISSNQSIRFRTAMAELDESFCSRNVCAGWLCRLSSMNAINCFISADWRNSKLRKGIWWIHATPHKMSIRNSFPTWQKNSLDESIGVGSRCVVDSFVNRYMSEKVKMISLTPPVLV